MAQDPNNAGARAAMTNRTRASLFVPKDGRQDRSREMAAKERKKEIRVGRDGLETIALLWSPFCVLSRLLSLISRHAGANDLSR
jgi:hypothetical protein